MCQWTAGATASLAILSIERDGVPRLRRGLRDVRDRMVRRSRRWCNVCFAGMAGGDGTALVLVSHEGLDRYEVLGAAPSMTGCRSEGVGAGGAGVGDVARRGR